MSVLHLNKNNFDEIVSKESKPVMVDFFADWCMPCKMFAPMLEKFAEEYSNSAVIAKLNIDEAEEIAVKYGVTSVPTIIIFKDGKEINRSVGAVSKGKLIELIGG